MTRGCELSALDALKSSGMLMTRTTLGYEHRDLDAMNNSRLSMG